MPRSPFSRREDRPEAVDYAEPLGRAVERGATTTTERWSDAQFRRQREQDLAESEMSSRSVLGAMMVCLAMAALLSSAKLVEITERMEFGWRRDVATDVAGAIDRVANATGLNRPADAIADIRSQGDDVGQTVEVIDEEALGVEPVDVVVPTTVRSRAPASTTTTEPAVEIIGAATPDAPIAAYLAGDSQAEFLGYSLEREGTDRGDALVVQSDSRVSTGLSRPDYFNWPAQLRQVVETDDPDAVVLFMGANDYQDMAVEDERLMRGTDQWRAEYARRVAVTMDLVVAENRRLFWVAQPPMRDATLQEGMTIINGLTRAAARERPEVVWIDAYELFGGDEGFSLVVAGPDGEDRVRSSDGVHLNATGADWLGEMVTGAMDRFWTFDDAEPPPTPTSTTSPSVGG